MSNSETFDRLSSLVKDIRPSDENDLRITALISACSLGIDMLKSELDDVENQQYLNTMSQETIDRYCDFLDIESSYDYDEKKSKIIEKLSADYDESNPDEFISYYKAYGDKFRISVNNFYMRLYGINSSNIYKLKEIMKRLEYYLAPFIVVKLDGAGLTFSEWESMNMTFQRFDSLKMHFSMIDTMKK